MAAWAASVPWACRCVCQRGSWEKYYFNPLMCPLPKAPSLKLYCMYGHNIPTERSYSYLNLEGPEARRPAEPAQRCLPACLPACPPGGLQAVHSLQCRPM